MSPPLSFAGEWLTQVSQKASAQQRALAGLAPFQPRSSAHFPTPTRTRAHQPSLHTGHYLPQMRKTRATRRWIQQLNPVKPKAGSAASLPGGRTTGRCQPAGGAEPRTPSPLHPLVGKGIPHPYRKTHNGKDPVRQTAPTLAHRATKSQGLQDAAALLFRLSMQAGQQSTRTCSQGRESSKAWEGEMGVQECSLA